MGKKGSQYHHSRGSKESFASDTTVCDDERDQVLNEKNVTSFTISGSRNAMDKKKNNNYKYGSINDPVNGPFMKFEGQSAIEGGSALDIDVNLQETNSPRPNFFFWRNLFVCRFKFASWFTASFVTIAYVVLIGDTTRGCLFPTLWPLDANIDTF